MSAAVLGLAVETPSHGYEVLQRFEALNRRLLATGADDVPSLLQVVDRYEQACLDEMAELHTHSRRTTGSAGGALDTIRDRLLTEERRLVLEARMRWILFARRQLEAVGAPPRRQPPTESA